MVAGDGLESLVSSEHPQQVGLTFIQHQLFLAMIQKIVAKHAPQRPVESSAGILENMAV
jgi:hypothetical protein